MRILHSLVITPGLCGLYESAKEFIKAETKLGHEVTVYEPVGASKNMTDNGVNKFLSGSISDKTFDVIVDHSGCDKKLLNSGLPIIHMRHGRPFSTFLIEHNGGLSVYSHMKTIGKDPRYTNIVTLWKEHVPYWEVLMNRPISFIPAPVNLEHYKPEGIKHTFGGKGADSGYNIVCADMWRDDECPFNILNQVIKETDSDKDFKVHIYGIQGKLTTAQQALLSCLGDKLGEVGWAKDMAPIYRAATEVITGTTINTRVVRESLACGCKVRNLNIDNPREYALANFDPIKSADALVSIAEESLCGC